MQNSKCCVCVFCRLLLLQSQWVPLPQMELSQVADPISWSLELLAQNLAELSVFSFTLGQPRRHPCMLSEQWKSFWYACAVRFFLMMSKPYWIMSCIVVLVECVCSHNYNLQQQQQQQPFSGPLSGTTRVSRYQKRHSPTHHPDHHPVFISFFPSTTIHSLLLVQITCLAIFLHNLFPCPRWSTSWSGALHLIFHTFLHPISVFFSQHMPIPSQSVLL